MQMRSSDHHKVTRSISVISRLQKMSPGFEITMSVRVSLVTFSHNGSCGFPLPIRRLDTAYHLPPTRQKDRKCNTLLRHGQLPDPQMYLAIFIQISKTTESSSIVVLASPVYINILFSVNHPRYSLPNKIPTYDLPLGTQIC